MLPPLRVAKLRHTDTNRQKQSERMRKWWDDPVWSAEQRAAIKIGMEWRYPNSRGEWWTHRESDVRKIACLSALWLHLLEKAAHGSPVG
jgi:hypothetical protein